MFLFCYLRNKEIFSSTSTKIRIFSRWILRRGRNTIRCFQGFRGSQDSGVLVDFFDKCYGGLDETVPFGFRNFIFKSSTLHRTIVLSLSHRYVEWIASCWSWLNFGEEIHNSSSPQLHLCRQLWLGVPWDFHFKFPLFWSLGQPDVINYCPQKLFDDNNICVSAISITQRSGIEIAASSIYYSVSRTTPSNLAWSASRFRPLAWTFLLQMSARRKKPWPTKTS